MDRSAKESHGRMKILLGRDRNKNITNHDDGDESERPEKWIRRIEWELEPTNAAKNFQIFIHKSREKYNPFADRILISIANNIMRQERLVQWCVEKGSRDMSVNRYVFLPFPNVLPDEWRHATLLNAGFVWICVGGIDYSSAWKLHVWKLRFKS